MNNRIFLEALLNQRTDSSDLQEEFAWEWMICPDFGISNTDSLGMFLGGGEL